MTDHPSADYDAGVEPLQECERCRVLCAPGMACVSSQPGHLNDVWPCRPKVPASAAEKDAACAAQHPSGRYSCNLSAGHDGTHMELTDRHSVAWGWTVDA